MKNPQQVKLLSHVEHSEYNEATSLINEGVDVNTADPMGRTLLFHVLKRAVVKEREVFLTNVLLANKVINLDAKDCHDNTPLHVAAESDAPERLELLLEHKKNNSTNAVNIRGETPLHNAVWAGKIESVKLLIKHEAKINAKAYDHEYICDDYGMSGFTAIHLAAAKGDLKMIELLVKHSADINAKNAQGQAARNIIEEQHPGKLTEFDRVISMASYRKQSGAAAAIDVKTISANSANATASPLQQTSPDKRKLTDPKLDPNEGPTLKRTKLLEAATSTFSQPKVSSDDLKHSSAASVSIAAATTSKLPAKINGQHKLNTNGHQHPLNHNQIPSIPAK